jgi:nucleotide-binding universal stress UspA family protein
MTAAAGSDRSAIVVGTDGSPSAARAVDCAANLAGSMDGVVHIVMAYKPLTPGAFTLHAPYNPATTAEEILTAAAERVRASNVEVMTHALHAAAADALIAIAEAEQARMIVVGSKGMDSGRRFLLGSVPDRVSHHAPCSVLIVRTGENAAQGEAEAKR